MAKPYPLKMGDKCGRWTVIGIELPSKQNTRVLCECGTQKVMSAYHLTSGKSTQCRRCAALSNPGNALRRMGGTHLAANDKFNQYRKGARDAGRVWEPTFEQFLEITQEPCFYCGSAPSNVNRIPEKEWAEDFWYNGIDRIDSRDGYLLDNIQPCCWKCNYMKRDKSQDDFLNHVRRIARYRDIRNNA